MINKKPTLGRGLADLLGQSSRSAPASVTSAPAAAPAPVGEELAKLPLDRLQRGKYQPRLDMRPETLQELADSIKAQGVVQPIVVRPVDPPAGASGTRRQSIPYFHNPSADSLVRCLAPFVSADRPARYEPVSYRDYALATLRAPVDAFFEPLPPEEQWRPFDF